MEIGFIVDEGYGSRTVAKWVEGEPESKRISTYARSAAAAAATSKAMPELR
jgi:hypothetical protein